MGNRSRSEPTEEAKEAVANWIVVPEEEPENKMFSHEEYNGDGGDFEGYDDFMGEVVENEEVLKFLTNKPCVCSLVSSPGATSVAASTGVQHLKLG